MQIDLRGEQLGRRTKVDYGFVGDTEGDAARSSAKAGAQTTTTNTSSSARTLSESAKRLGRARDRRIGHRNRSILNTWSRVIDELAADDAIFSCDVGTPTIWAARYLTMNGKRRLLGSFNHGSMANALPQAIGAQDRSSRPTSYVHVRRWRPRHAHGRSAFASTVAGCRSKSSSSENDRLAFVELEMKAAGIRRVRNRSAESGFCKNGRRRRGAGTDGGNTRQDVRPMIAQALEHDGPGVSRGHRPSAGTLHASDDKSRANKRLQPLHAQGSSQRPGGRNCRSGKDQSLPLARSAGAQSRRCGRVVFVEERL